jgi:CubicO group peptidase (beta-lactamase class C family)
MPLTRRAFVAGALLSPALSTMVGCAPSPPSTVDLSGFGDFLGQQADAGRFAGAVLVARDGRPLFERAYGMADRSRQVANMVGTRFGIASMGKMFTAVSIAQLVQAGRLSFADTIGKYLTGYPFPAAVADGVTIAQLLTHTAGMGDALQRTPDGPPPPTSLAGLMGVIARTPLLFAPGSSFGYSNSGFIVLGAIIEQVTGGAYADYVHGHVFGPAGMADTAIEVYRPVDIANLAHPYALVDPTGQPVPPGGTGSLRDVGDQVEIGNPSGGAYSTVGDVVRFAGALTGHRLLSPALTDTVLAGKVATPRPGRPDDRYGYGFDDATVNGVRIVGHNGGSPGYEGQLDCYPTLGYTVAILTNQDGVLVPAIQRSEAILTG